MAGVTHVLHLATCKETPEAIMDVAIKGLFWLLEACRSSPTFRQLVLIGGDASVGPLRPCPPHPRDRDPEAQRLSGLLRAVEGPRRGHAGAVLRPIRPERLLPPRSLDHGEGRFQVPALFRRGRFRRPPLARPRRSREGRRIREGAGHSRDAGPGGPAGEAQLRPCRRPGGRDPRVPSTIRRPVSRRSTSAWTSPSTTASWAPTWPSHGACPPCPSGLPITRPGSTTRRPGFSWAGGRATT